MTTETPARPTLKLPYLHPSQQLIAEHPARFKVVCCGRRWGKTMLGIAACLKTAIEGGRVWWVAPTYKQALEGWKYLLEVASQPPLSLATRTQLTELILHVGAKGSVQIRTADNPNTLRGAGLHGVVLDEAATMKQETWTEVLRPALSDTGGWAMFISTPQHFNWFYDLFEVAEGGALGWHAWQFPTWDNSEFISEAEIDAARRDMLPEDFDQEFGASFTAIGGAVFRLFSANRSLYLRPMSPGLNFRRIGIGMDWGTTKEHQAAVVCGGILDTGAVWITSNWLSDAGSSNDWYDEADVCRRNLGARFARVDRSQSSAIDRLKGMGFDADKGNPNVEGRIGDIQGLAIRKAIFFDSNDQGVRTLFNHICAYHRDKEGKVVEEEDDDVDALAYLVSELVKRGGIRDGGSEAAATRRGYVTAGNQKEWRKA